MSQYLQVEKQSNGMITLWLNRPEARNALNPVLIQEITNTLSKLANDDGLRVLVLRGRGSHFCAGADLHWMKDSINKSHDENYDDAAQLAKLLTQLNEFPTPIIAYAQGGAFGGGIGLLACCDIILAEPQTAFSFSEVKLGLVPAIISPFVLPRIGIHHGRRYMLTAEQFDGKVAKDIGLVHELINHDQADRWINYFAKQFLSAGPYALRTTKKLIGDLYKFDGSDELTVKCIADVRKGKEAQSLLKAFFESKEEEKKQ